MIEGADSQPETLVQTEVAVYLGDCTGDRFQLVCDGMTIEPEGSFEERALLALERPSPRGPYPVSARFTAFVHEARLDGDAQEVVLFTTRIDVACMGTLANVSVQRGQSLVDFAPVSFTIGDDVITIARAVLRALS
ncbi:hypothetical protein [Paraburkholderia sp. CI3]|uniref:hypothetical protein n=1 Tax=Paraburkholderia sp. CI3 TaxID=2991060 RepID=UPI003D1CA3A4